MFGWCWLAGPAQATHLLGGELTYRYLDTNGPAGAPGALRDYGHDL
ncbi:MAG: hypothetical protein WKG07_05265 [Hymenobacter sp.]